MFKTVRRHACGALVHGRAAGDGVQQLPCRWQDAGASGHQAIYCNLVSHLDTLYDVLDHGDWCDDVDLPATLADTDEAERLFRYYTIVFLLAGESIADLRNVWRVLKAEHGGKRIVDVLTTDINRIWKHRNLEHGRSGRVMHRDHHHGPYLFVDALEELGVSVRPTDYDLDVPSLPDAMRTLCDALRYTDTLLDTAGHAAVDATYPRRPDPTSAPA